MNIEKLFVQIENYLLKIQKYSDFLEEPLKLGVKEVKNAWPSNPCET